MTASGVLFPLGGKEDEGGLARFLMVAPGAAVVSTMAHSRDLEASLTEIANNLEAAEAHLAAAASTTDSAAAQGQELHEIWLLVAALMADSETPSYPSPGPAPAWLRSWPASTTPSVHPAHNERPHPG
jgi:hypothetical protein